MKTLKHGFYATRTNGKWELVTPFRRREGSLEEVCGELTK